MARRTDARNREGPAGQSLADFVLLTLLLALLAGGVALLLGPGLDRSYDAFGEWWSQRVAPRLSALPTSAAVCADIEIAGSASFLDLDGDGHVETVQFGGPGNCSQARVAVHPEDPLGSNAALGWLRCVAIDPLTLDVDYSESEAGVAFKPASPSSTLRLLERAGGAPLLSADIAWGTLTLSTLEGTLRVAALSAVETDNRIDSPALAAFGSATDWSGGFLLPSTAGLLNVDATTGKLILAARSAPFTARLSAVCRR